jgi:uncharacterized CHY-type Zn-finger protein
MKKLYSIPLLFIASLSVHATESRPRIPSAREVEKLIQKLVDTDNLCKENPRSNRGACAMFFACFKSEDPAMVALFEQLKNEVFEQKLERNAQRMPLSESEIEQAQSDITNVIQTSQDPYHPDYNIARAQAVNKVAHDETIEGAIRFIEDTKLSDILPFEELIKLVRKKDVFESESEYEARKKKKCAAVQACFDNPNSSASNPKHAAECKDIQKTLALIGKSRKLETASIVAHIIKTKFTE